MYADYFGIFSIKTFCITSLHSIHFLKHLFDTLHQPTTALYIDKALRIRLKDATFMCFPDHVNRSPNLLDQEVRSFSSLFLKYTTHRTKTTRHGKKITEHCRRGGKRSERKRR